MVKCTELEEDEHVEPPVQTTKISDFFSPKSGIVNGKKPSSSSSLKTTKADKKRKKADIDESKVVTNGSEEVEDEKGHKSPPAKKRIEDDDEKPSKNGSNANAVTSGSTTPTSATAAAGSSISNFFRPISKSDFIKDSEKRTLTVKAMVHSPSEIRSALKPESQEPKESKEDGVVKVGEEGCTPTPKKSKKRRSKYVRKGEESIDVIQVINDDSKPDEEKNADSEDVIDKNEKQLPENNNDQVTKVSSSIFKPKPSKQQSQSRKVEEDEDTVDIDFPASMRAPMTLTAGATPQASPPSSSTPTSAPPQPVKVSLFKHQGGQTRGRKRKKGKGGCEDLHYDSDSIDIDVLATFSAKTFEAQSTGLSSASSPPLESNSSLDSCAGAFSVLLKKPLLKDELATAKKADEGGQCDSDKKVVVVNTEEIKTPAPTAEVETKDEASGLEAAANSNPIAAASSHSTAAVASKVNAFSRLMEKRGKNKNVEEDAVSAMPKNDNDTSIGINGDVSASVDAQSAPPSKRPKKKRGRPSKATVLVPSATTEELASEEVVTTSANTVSASDLNSSLNDFVVTEDAIKADEKEQDNGRRKSQRIRRNHQLKMETRSCSSDQKMAESEDEHPQDQEEWEEDRSVSDLRTRPQKRPRTALQQQQPPTNRRSGAKKKQKESLESQPSTRKSSSSDSKAKIKKPFEAGDGVASSESDDDEIKIEKVIGLKPIAPIFETRRKFKKASAAGGSDSTTRMLIEEDPEKVAARKAFLLSSVPQALKSQVDRHRSSCDEIATLLTPFASTIGHVTQIAASENFPLTAAAIEEGMLRLRNFLEDEQPFAIKTSMAGYHGKELKVSDSSSSPVVAASISMEQKSPRLTAPQIYSHFLSIRQGLLPSASSSDTGGNDGREEIERLQFTRAFRRYLERKIEADTLEEEARSKNVSLNEIEEKRGAAASRRLRSSKSRKKKAKEISKQQNTATPESSIKVKYDPGWPSSMQWTMKYAPQCAEDIIGNSETVKELASWLREWEMRDVKRRKRCNKAENGMDTDSESDSISTYSEDSSIVGDEEDVGLPNTALLVGPTGVGKTASVYALAHEMGFKVLEVNASATRNGRQVSANLREATQSHHVRKSGKNRHVLILFEDIDQFFGEADEGFYSAVNSLIASTKRPILLTTSSPSFLSMQMGSGKSKVLKILPQDFHFRPVDPVAAARHLQLLALVEGFPIDITSLTSLCTIYHGNVSKSLLALQWWTLLLSEEQNSSSLSSCKEKLKTESDSKDSNRDVCLAGLKPEDNTEEEAAAIVSLMSIGKAKSYQMPDYHYSLNMDLLLGSEGQNVSYKAGTTSRKMMAASASTASSPIFEWHHYNMLLPALANLRPTSSCNEPSSSLLEPQASSGSAVNTELADVPKWKRHLHLSKDVFAADSSSDEEDLEEQKEEEEGKDDKETVEGEKATSSSDSASSCAPFTVKEKKKEASLIETANSRTTAVARPSAATRRTPLQEKEAEEASVGAAGDPTAALQAKDGETPNQDSYHQENLRRQNRKEAMNFLCSSMEAASHFMPPPCFLATHDKNETWTDVAAQIMELTVASNSSLHASSDSDSSSSSPPENYIKNTKDLIIEAYQFRDLLDNTPQRKLQGSAHEQVLQTALSNMDYQPLTVHHRLASMDVLPILRSMARSEAGRKQRSRNEVKRSRSGRFIHYFDTAQIDLTEQSLRALENPIPFLSYTTEGDL